jgi:hypothetical protein
MNVNLILKFRLFDRNMRAKELKNIVEFNETTCIKNYKAPDYNVNISPSGIEYVYENVPFDSMHELYSDVKKYEGLISIIINEFGSR